MSPVRSFAVVPPIEKWKARGQDRWVIRLAHLLHDRAPQLRAAVGVLRADGELEMKQLYLLAARARSPTAHRGRPRSWAR